MSQDLSQDATLTAYQGVGEPSHDHGSVKNTSLYHRFLGNEPGCVVLPGNRLPQSQDGILFP